MNLPDRIIPDASYSALFQYEEDRTRTSPEETIRAVAAPLIAQTLRELAGPLEEFVRTSDAGFDQRDKTVAYRNGIADVATRLRARADELAPVETDAADGMPL